MTLDEVIKILKKIRKDNPALGTAPVKTWDQDSYVTVTSVGKIQFRHPNDRWEDFVEIG